MLNRFIVILFIAGSLCNLQARSVNTDQSRQIAHMWAYPAYVPGNNYAAVFQSAISRQNAYARRALSYYEEAREKDRQYADKKKLTDSAIESNRLWLRNPVWYKALEENDYLRRVFSHVSRQHHLDQAELYHNTYTTLADQAGIKDELYYAALRMYITHSVAAGMFSRADDALNFYSENPQASTEWPFYYYRFVCELSRYKRFVKNPGVSEELQNRSLKLLRRYLLASVSLRYGSDSLQYSEALTYADRKYPDLTPEF